MKKIILLLIFVLLLASCDTKTEEINANNQESILDEELVEEEATETEIENNNIDVSNYSTNYIHVSGVDVNIPEGWELINMRKNYLYYKDSNPSSETYDYGYGFLIPNDDTPYLASAYVYDCLSVVSCENEKVTQYALDGIIFEEFSGEYATFLIKKAANVISDYPDTVFALPMYLTMKFEYADDNRTLIYFLTSPNDDIYYSETILNEIIKNN